MNQRGGGKDQPAEQAAFDDFMRRIRSGDEQAAAELVRLYEPTVRREVRLHIRDRRLRRLFDSGDVCQSVLGSFFVHTALGQYDITTCEQLITLLVGMTRNKVAEVARRQHRQCRDHRRTMHDPQAVEQVADPQPTPSETISAAELLKRFRAVLSEDELALADLRAQGLAWSDIASRMGGSASARRMQWARALERASREIGLDEPAT